MAGSYTPWWLVIVPISTASTNAFVIAVKVGLVFKFPCRPGPPEIPRGFGEFRLIKAIVIVGRKGVGLILPRPCRSRSKRR